MLSRPGWPSGYPGVPLPEVPCSRCERRVAGLAWGDLCSDCLAERRGRANRLSQRISFPAALVVAAWALTRMSSVPMARLYAGIAVLATYLIVRRIVHHIAMEYLPR